MIYFVIFRTLPPLHLFAPEKLSLLCGTRNMHKVIQRRTEVQQRNQKFGIRERNSK